MSQVLRQDSANDSVELKETWLDDLAAARKVPGALVKACLAHFDIVAPKLRALLVRAADGERLGEAEERAFFWGVHILGLGRDVQSFKPLLRLLARPDEELDDMFGDTMTVTLPRVAASVFDGDIEALFELLADRGASEFVRSSFLEILAFLTFEGRIDKTQTEAFLARFDAEPLAADEDQCWIGWQLAIAHLGLRSFAERVEGRSHQDVLVSFFGKGPQAFYKDLEAAESAPHDPARFKKDSIGYFDEMVEALSWVRFDLSEEKKDFFDRFAPLPKPAINPWRNIGRNDPCLCGSGKKAKKCCLA
jgi:hypothetical protein